MRKAAHRVSLEAGDTLRQGGALGNSEVVNFLWSAQYTLLVCTASQI
jgi:hypothetical protein